MKPVNEKPSRNEDEYFARQNAEMIKEMRAKLDAEREKAANQKVELECPRCGVALVEREANHVKMDSCPKCSGIWLDAGELEQLQRVNRERGVTGGVLSNLFRRD
jgi:uncharacterized protein